MTTTKKRINSFSINDKLRILRECEFDGTIREVSEKYKVPITTLRGWISNKELLEEQSLTCASSNSAKRIKPSLLDDLEKALYVWYDINSQKGIPLSGPMIKAKALELHEEMKIRKTFVASDGWLGHWKLKYGIKRFNGTVEKIAADPPQADLFKEKFVELIEKEELALCQIFNADESGLYYKMMPNEILTETKMGSAIKGNRFKDRLTVMLCSNADGSLKLPPVVVGKSISLGAFDNLSRNLLPVYYDYQDNAWMSVSIFKKWFENEFVPKVKSFLRQKYLPEKAVLLLDNAPCHLSVEDIQVGDIKVQYLPANVTAIVQPMEQGIIRSFKKLYKSRFLQSLIQSEINNVEVDAYLESLDLTDVMYWLGEAWNTLNSQTIFQCWKNLLPSSYYTNTYLDSTFNESSVNEHIINCVHHLDGFQNVENEDILNWIDFNDEMLDVPSSSELIGMINEKPKVQEKSECKIKVIKEAKCVEKYVEVQVEDKDNQDKEIAKNAVTAADALLTFCTKYKIGNTSTFHCIINLKEKALKFASEK